MHQELMLSHVFVVKVQEKPHTGSTESLELLTMCSWERSPKKKALRAILLSSTSLAELYTYFCDKKKRLH